MWLLFVGVLSFLAPIRLLAVIKELFCESRQATPCDDALSEEGPVGNGGQPGGTTPDSAQRRSESADVI